MSMTLAYFFVLFDFIFVVKFRRCVQRVVMKRTVLLENRIYVTVRFTFFLSFDCRCFVFLYFAVLFWYAVYDKTGI